MESILPSQPESYRQLLRRSIVLYRLSFKKIALFAFLLSLTVFIPRILSDTVGQDILANVTPLSPHQVWLLAINFAGLLFFIAIVWHMHCVIIDKHEPLSEDFRVALNKVINAFLASIIQSAILFAVVAVVYGIQLLLLQYHHWLVGSALGMFVLTLILIGNLFLLLYVSTLFIFLIPLIAIENKGIIASLERTVYLVWNHWFRAFSLQVTPWICFIVALIVMRYLFGLNIHIYFAQQVSHPLWVTALQLVLFALFVPWLAATLLVQLKDLELRKHISA